ncbi:MAG TPA: polysaccharide lyase family 7 protein [Pseudonocardia sp.]|jgi:hypothetical protein|uniref:polysaccharide lyase family 7 protein n=1 Tax=Pseudonocardia sp. TaxID=60912 RepID=UPI002ED9BD41
MHITALSLALAAASSVLLGPVAAVPVAARAPMPAAAPAVPGDDSTACTEPAQVLDLSNWKVTLPFGGAGNAKSPLEVTQPELANYATAPWFNPTPACDAVVFRAPVDGVTTKGSRNPRSELREMADNGANTASWSSTAGTHMLTVTEAFTHLPDGKPELVGAQIHDAADDITVFRLEGPNLYITEGDNPHYKLVTSTYALGTKFEARYVVRDGKVNVYYNGALQTTISNRFSGAYFKAGAYTQANCGNSSPCSSSNYGETTIYDVSVFHHVTPWDIFWDWFTSLLPLALAAAALIAVGWLGWRRSRTHPAFSLPRFGRSAK